MQQRKVIIQVKGIKYDCHIVINDLKKTPEFKSEFNFFYKIYSLQYRKEKKENPKKSASWQLFKKKKRETCKEWSKRVIKGRYTFLEV